MDVSTLPSYRYTPLPTGTQADNIRLLKIRAGNERDPIRCELVHTSLSSTPRYLALSYCWGDASNKVPIIVADGPGQYVISITQNLHSALWQLRKLDSEDDHGMPIWVDAVCMYPDRHRTKCCRNLRFWSSVLWGGWFCALSVPIWAWRPPRRLNDYPLHGQHLVQPWQNLPSRVTTAKV